MNKKQWKKYLPGLICILPWVIGFLVFQLYPLVVSMVYSLTDFKFGSSFKFVGLDNYIYMFMRDRDFKNSIKVTLLYVFFSVPLKLVFALIIAMILNMKIKGVGIFRTLYYLPSILGSSVGIAVLWKSLFNRGGLVNIILGKFGVSPIDWLGSPKVALYTIALLAIWQFGSSMVIFLAALKQVPQDLIDSARVDGAGKIRVFFSIVLPMISPMLLFNLVMQTSNAFRQFNSPYLITQGGPLKATYLFGLMIYKNAFELQKMAYACAQSWILFVMILALTLMIFKSSPYWTFYSDGGQS